MVKHTILTVLVLLLPFLNGVSQKTLDRQEETWVDSIFETLTLDQKIGQMMMIRAFSKGDKSEEKKILALIEKEDVGGICFFQGSPNEQLRLNNLYQSKSKTPLLIAMDGEWGLGMRHRDSTISYPKQLMLGAIQDNNLIYEMGKDIGRQCKRIGVNVNFAPVADVNNNIHNPVINDRSFGEDKINVAAKSYAYMQGLQEAGVLASAKHFPGHGDTDVDSHHDLPIIKHDMDRLNNIELFPFKSLINLGIGSIMVAHLHIPALDKRSNRATTLSRPTVYDLLRTQLRFDGLIFTDAMEMKGVTKHFESGQADAEAVLAGNDIVLLPLDVVKAKAKIKAYIHEGKINQEQIDQSVRRILRAKYRYKNYDQLPAVGLREELNSNTYLSLKSKLIEEALTLVSNEDQIVPIKNQNQKFLSVALGASEKTAFQKRLDDYGKFQHISHSRITLDQKAKTIYSAKSKDVIIISLHNKGKKASNNFGLSQIELDFIQEISRKKTTILVLFGSPYALINFDQLDNVIVAYDSDNLIQDITAQSLFGVNPFLGKLPVTASPKYHLNLGITTPALGRLGFSIPERVGMNSSILNRINLVADTIMKTKAAPGCQVLLARKGKIIWHKAYGHFTYENKKEVSKEHIYDLASITKVLASTLSIMKLEEESEIDIDLPLQTYLPVADTSNKKDISLKAMMAHHGKLKPWIPFYENTIIKKKKKTSLNPAYYSETLKDSFSIPVAEHLFLRSDYTDTIVSKILGSDLRETDDYRYSDLGFYLAGFCVENKCLSSLDRYVNNTFYKPLGLHKTLFNPLNKIPKEAIIPSEKDDYFRNQTLQGEVHDMGAAMMGGVSGHAGLFSNAYEVSILAQMLLNGGYYGGRQYFKPRTIERYTQRHPFSTRRGIGFDMKELDRDKTLNISKLASDRTYGHYGFTGTAVFIDPIYDLVYVFLSNRTYPSMNNNKLNKNNYRTTIQSIAYEAIMDKRTTSL